MGRGAALLAASEGKRHGQMHSQKCTAQPQTKNVYTVQSINGAEIEKTGVKSPDDSYLHMSNSQYVTAIH